MKYSYRSHGSTVDPSTVYSELLKIQKTKGRLKAVDVVENARPKRSPLHPCFEWDDEAAAEEYRLFQARNLIHSIRVRDSEDSEPKRVFVSIKDPEGHGHTYYTTQQISVTPELRAKMMSECFAELIACKAKYRELSDIAKFQPVFREIERLEEDELAS